MRNNILFLSLTFSFLFSSCVFDDPKPSINEVQRSVVSFEDLDSKTSSSLLDLLKDSLGESIYEQRNTLNYDKFTLDWDNIYIRKDSIGNKVFVFLLIEKNKNSNIFHNLIINYNQNTGFDHPYILRYTMKDKVAEQFKRQPNMHQFQGEIKKISLDSYNSGAIEYGSAKTVRGVTNPDCEEPTLETGEPPSGGGSTPFLYSTTHTYLTTVITTTTTCHFYVITTVWRNSVDGVYSYTDTTQEIVKRCNTTVHVDHHEVNNGTECDMIDGGIPIAKPEFNCDNDP